MRSSFVNMLVPLVDDISPLLGTIPSRSFRFWSFSLLLLFWSGPLLLVRTWGFLAALLLLPVVLALATFTPSPFELVHALWSLLGAVFRVLKVHLLEEFFLETFGEGFNVHVVAVTSALAAPIDVLLALCVEEVSHWRKDSAYFFALEKSAIDVVESVLGILLIAVFNIYVSHDMVAQVVNDNHILDFTVLAHLFEDFLIELLESKLD